MFWRPLATHKIYIKHCGSRWLRTLHRWKDFSGLTAHGELYSWGCPVALLGLSLTDIWVPRQMIIKQIRIAMTGLIVGSILGGAPVTLLGLSRKGDRWTPQEIRDWSTVPPCKPNVFFPYMRQKLWHRQKVKTNPLNFSVIKIDTVPNNNYT